MIENGSLKLDEPLLVLGRNTGSDKVSLEDLVVNGEKSDQANRGDKITFPIDQPLKSGDKLSKLVTSDG